VSAATTIVEAVAESLPEFGSTDAVLTALDGRPNDAVLLITVPGVAPGSTSTTSVIVADAPFASGPRSHVNVAVPRHDPTVGKTETKDVPAGTESVIRALSASAGPLFVTVIVYVRSEPAVTGSGESVLVIARSADGGGGACTVVVAAAELLPGSGSAVVGELEVAVFVTSVSTGVAASTVTTIVNTADAPIGNSA
jgi:hypothetical protein